MLLLHGELIIADADAARNCGDDFPTSELEVRRPNQHRLLLQLSQALAFSLVVVLAYIANNTASSSRLRSPRKHCLLLHPPYYTHHFFFLKATVSS